MSAFIEVMYTSSYGGGFFSKLSKEAFDRYQETTKNPYNIYAEDARNDPDMIKIVKEMENTQKESAGCSICIAKIPVELSNYYYVQDNDGAEDVIVEYDKYRAQTSKAILKDDSLSHEERVKRALHILETRFQGEPKE
jgi:hypothetical protein